MESSKYQLAEWRISIYGRKASEWDLLSRWFFVHKLAHSNIRWLIQIPRLYHIYKKSGEINSFEDMLYNIFAPLYAVSIDPSSNPALHYFLKTVVAFDSVDDGTFYILTSFHDFKNVSNLCYLLYVSHKYFTNILSLL